MNKFKLSHEFIGELGENSSDLDLADKFIEYAKQFIDTASELADSKYPTQNKQSILNLKQLIK